MGGGRGGSRENRGERQERGGDQDGWVDSIRAISSFAALLALDTNTERAKFSIPFFSPIHRYERQ